MVNFIVFNAGVVCAVCSIASAIANEFGAPRDSIRRALAKYAVSWSPTSLFGEDDSPGKSPLFFIMWTTVWLLCGFIFPLYAFVIGLADSYVMPATDDVFNSASFLGAGLVLAGAWSFLITLETLNSPWAAAAVNTLGAALMLTAVAIYRPFLREVWHISTFVGFPYEFSTGWVCYMTALSISMAVQDTDHGGDKDRLNEPSGPPSTSKDEYTKPRAGQAFVPLAAAGGLAVFAFLFGTPVLALPFALSMLYTRSDASWWHWGAFGVALLACVLGIVTVASGLRIL
jgi:hypothetical protein